MKRGWAYKKTCTLAEDQVFDIIAKPLVTEKTTTVSANGCYVFEVAKEATKPEIKAAVEKLFKVKVEKVSTLVAKGKTKRFRGITAMRSDKKKAYVTLKGGDAIDVTAGI